VNSTTDITGGLLDRRHPLVRRIVEAWRRETGGAPTLLACSGGADSTALALALTAGGADVTLAHVVHDLRPRGEALADRDMVFALAERLGVEAVAEEAMTSERAGNSEANARRARYAALASMARAGGLGFVATAHHADDQFESVLMALLRGTGLNGLRGLARRRAIEGAGPEEGQVILVRPMLDIGRTESERLCEEAGVDWAIDATNFDPERLRSSLRQGPLEDLRLRRPGVERRVAATADLLRDAAGLVRERAEEVFGGATRWDRASLRRERAIVVGEGLRRCALRLTRGVGADRLSQRALEPLIGAVRDASGERRVFRVAGSVEIEVGREWVSARRVASGGSAAEGGGDET